MRTDRSDGRITDRGGERLRDADDGVTVGIVVRAIWRIPYGAGPISAMAG